jgi:ABC-type amino acid transport substrate-binding protein
MKSFRMNIAVFLFLVLFCAGCATSQVSEQKPAATDLRVGVSPDFPPLIFRQNNGITGIEADLARELGSALQRPVRFVVLNWEDQISALLDHKIDIIMSGMSTTRAREVRIAFAEPYLKSGLLAAMSAEDAKKYQSKDSILTGFAAVGAVMNTTGDAFVRRNFPNATRKTFLPTAKDGATELKRRSIDIFVDDAPSIIWLVSENETDIAGSWELLTEEHLAWGVRKEDQNFLVEVNAVLHQWKNNGTLDEILKKWLPDEYLKRMK